VNCIFYAKNRIIAQKSPIIVNRQNVEIFMNEVQKGDLILYQSENDELDPNRTIANFATVQYVGAREIA